MFFESGVVLFDFGPKSAGVVGVVDVRKFVDNDIITERFGNFHKADIERNDNTTIWMMGTGAPAGVGVREADFIVVIAV